MNILIRADGSLNIGLGHIFRCLTIANYFKKTYDDIQIYFITQSDPEVQNKLLRDYICIDPDEKLIVNDLVKTSDLFISDMLDTSNSYVSDIKMQNPLIKLVCIDNNTQLKYIESADVVFNANVFQKPKVKDNSFKYHLGPDYMILRDSFISNHLKIIDKTVNNLFISFGGSDEKGCTLKMLSALKTINKSFKISVIVGPMFQYLDELEKLTSKDDRIKIIREPKNIYELMDNADLAIISAGITLYEICCLGVPSIVIPQVKHQSDIAIEFANNKACINLGYNPKSMDIKKSVEKLISDFDLRNKLSTNGKEFVDGKGLKRFIEIVMDDLNAKTI